MFKGVRDNGHASATKNANLSLAIIFPGLTARYLLQSFEKLT